MPSAEECPVFAHALDLNSALLAVSRQNWDQASHLLTKWDQRLQKSNGTHLWFETRLRLIAMTLMSGNQRQAEVLARQLEQRARTANDYLTLRRVQHLLDSDQPSRSRAGAGSIPSHDIESGCAARGSAATARGGGSDDA